MCKRVSYFLNQIFKTTILRIVTKNTILYYMHLTSNDFIFSKFRGIELIKKRYISKKSFKFILF
ncbi:hypothetical protein DDQ68_19245 [Hymenobacter nivis]|uniref:Uncharacterized protein n=1 Tax=Hymenobacter nivis TaxID=1850093 RepID=A0A2Z3GRJ5_9BACT|nr:hypothetical protein DDQ68_19245 [Hymenobacter nivis]